MRMSRQQSSGGVRCIQARPHLLYTALSGKIMAIDPCTNYRSELQALRDRLVLQNLKKDDMSRENNGPLVELEHAPHFPTRVPFHRFRVTWIVSQRTVG